MLLQHFAWPADSHARRIPTADLLLSDLQEGHGPAAGESFSGQDLYDWSTQNLDAPFEDVTAFMQLDSEHGPHMYEP